ncbi:Oidioi.mRNA.OKI2018_I69.XSR.g13509.t2.cds [Oikopleura dioica]|uniref:Oidioi.mRNA.OKI2018_I69.XSR.g13509.t2.cds n=1 Tax=Oikopleura dioica TaxID=34765 RepID=A0ABN7S732_OIKDI|nr:Oidioi.mRNA.OKI2018_I69.XSR.g13509.t2.cds [Oikopleura dioica]
MQEMLEKTWEEFEKSLNIQEKKNHQSRMFGNDLKEMEGSGGSIQRSFGFQEGSGNTGFSAEPIITVDFEDNEDFGGVDEVVEEPPTNTPIPIHQGSTPYWATIPGNSGSQSSENTGSDSINHKSTTPIPTTTTKTLSSSSSFSTLVSTLTLTTSTFSDQSSTQEELGEDPPILGKSLVAVIIPTIMFLVAVAILFVMFGNRKASEIKPMKKFAQDEPGSNYDKWDHEMAPGHVNPSYYNPNFLLPTVTAQIDEQTGPSSIIDVPGSAQLSTKDISENNDFSLDDLPSVFSSESDKKTISSNHLDKVKANLRKSFTETVGTDSSTIKVDSISINSDIFKKDQKEAGYISESCEIAKAFEKVKGRSIKERDVDVDSIPEEEGNDDVVMDSAPCSDVQMIVEKETKKETSKKKTSKHANKNIAEKVKNAKKWLAKAKSDSLLVTDSESEYRRRNREKGKMLPRMEDLSEVEGVKPKVQRRKSVKERNKKASKNSNSSLTNSATTQSQTRTLLKTKKNDTSADIHTSVLDSTTGKTTTDPTTLSTHGTTDTGTTRTTSWTGNDQSFFSGTETGTGTKTGTTLTITASTTMTSSRTDLMTSSSMTRTTETFTQTETETETEATTQRSRDETSETETRTHSFSKVDETDYSRSRDEISHSNSGSKNYTATDYTEPTVVNTTDWSKSGLNQYSKSYSDISKQNSYSEKYSSDERVRGYSTGSKGAYSSTLSTNDLRRSQGYYYSMQNEKIEEDERSRTYELSNLSQTDLSKLRYKLSKIRLTEIFCFSLKISHIPILQIPLLQFIIIILIFIFIIILQFIIIIEIVKLLRFSTFKKRKVRQNRIFPPIRSSSKKSHDETNLAAPTHDPTDVSLSTFPEISITEAENTSAEMAPAKSPEKARKKADKETLSVKKIETKKSKKSRKSPTQLELKMSDFMDELEEVLSEMSERSDAECQREVSRIPVRKMLSTFESEINERPRRFRQHPVIGAKAKRSSTRSKRVSQKSPESFSEKVERFTTDGSTSKSPRKMSFGGRTPVGSRMKSYLGTQTSGSGEQLNSRTFAKVSYDQYTSVFNSDHTSTAPSITQTPSFTNTTAQTTTTTTNSSNTNNNSAYSAVEIDFDRSSISSDTELNDNRPSTRPSTTYDMDV